MPELPEVETIVKRLDPLLTGQRIVGATVKRETSFRGDPNQVLNQTVRQVSRRAKLIRLHLENDSNLLIHLKMTGQLIYTTHHKRVGGGHPTQDWVQALPSKHTRVIFDLDHNKKLFFNDMRAFGWVWLAKTSEVHQEFDKLGPDINDPKLTAKNLYGFFQNRSIAVKTALLTPQIVAGLGNIYACDALYLAGINPWRPAKSMSFAEVSKLLESARKVIGLGIELEGASINTYTTAEGLSGGYQDVMYVYDRVDEPCRRCQEPIRKAKLAGRGTYYCQNCQK